MNKRHMLGAIVAMAAAGVLAANSGFADDKKTETTEVAPAVDDVVQTHPKTVQPCRNQHHRRARVPVPDFGRIDAQIAGARGQEAEALAAYRLAALRATEDVENAFSALVKREAQAGILTRGESSLARARENAI